VVFKLLKFFLGLGCLGIFVWWGLTVPLGERTLFGHLRAIGHTRESQELVRGTKQKVGDIKRRIAGEDKGKGAEKPAPAGEAAPKTQTAPVEGPPQEHLTDADRRDMRKILEGARASGGGKAAVR
jgi:hypothetical protein